MKTVGQIMIEGEDVEIGSDSDVSDTSQISINIRYQSGLDLKSGIQRSLMENGPKILK